MSFSRTAGVRSALAIAFKRTLVKTGRDLPTVFITALEPEDASGPLAALAPVAVLNNLFKNEDLLAAIGRAGNLRPDAPPT